jgi:hypothetical protein
MPIVIKHPNFQAITEIENSDLPSMPKVENANLASCSAKVQDTDLHSDMVREIDKPRLNSE